MKTAVEWIEKQLIEGKMRPVEIIAIAKAMEKEQIIEANENKMPFITGEEYYNETYKNKKE